MHFVIQDLRYALRMFKRNWGFTLTALTVMALSICATVAIFSAVNAIILRPLPYQNSERLVTVWGRQPKVPIRANPSDVGSRAAPTRRASARLVDVTPSP